jgi:murein DD-endopeptidase MepM/ murein hydrolase activator NlpD
LTVRRLSLLLCAVALVTTGAARADVFAIVPDPAQVPSTGSPWALAPVASQPLDFGQLLPIWQRAGAEYGIPWPVLAAINKVESNFGQNMGPSSAGAIGWMQFMPSTWAEWGTDGNGDGVADPWNAEDAIVSAARYLAAAGGATDIARAVYAYNHADWYVTEVLDLAQLYAQGGSTAVTFDQVQSGLEAARQSVAATNAQLVAQLAVVQRLARVTQRWQRLEDRAELLSTRLAYGKQAGLAQAREALARAEADALARRLARARRDLARLRAAAAPMTFAPGTASLFGAPAYFGRYVFPVGGGPGLVSVAHTHHDYPAADIAAPEGSPVYALSNGVVVRAWQQPEPSCGIGLTYRTDDGQEWTYCHLSYEEPDVRPGAALAAGSPVGLVGMTGDATGPHLHLQLDPPTSYPQNEGWFQSFAGVAFAWQDAPTPEVATARTLAVLTGAPSTVAFSPRPVAPVFRVVSADPGVVLFRR